MSQVRLRTAVRTVRTATRELGAGVRVFAARSRRPTAIGTR